MAFKKARGHTARSVGDRIQHVVSKIATVPIIDDSYLHRNKTEKKKC